MRHQYLWVLSGVFLALGINIPLTFAESKGDQITKPYKPSTVRVMGVEEGFGFVVGVQRDFAFIITAKHVIDGPPSQPRPNIPINIQFFQEVLSTDAKIVERHQLLDMVLLRASLPQTMQFDSIGACTRYQRSDPVWWVGQNKKWDVPLDGYNGKLRVSRPDSADRIEFNSIGIEPGVSGAPLITGGGIVGMVIEDSPPNAYALDIDKIRRFAKDNNAPWTLLGCNNGGFGFARAEEPGVTEKPKRCWDGWVHKKVCQDRLADGSQGPAMVMLSGGTFTMGSNSDEADGDEKPPRSVKVDPFAIAQREVTVAEFQRFVGAKNYRTEAEQGDGCYSWTGTEWKQEPDTSWDKPGFEQAPNHPVTCVSWNDANAYVRWLSEQTNHSYRLPTEAEWEYAARAGSATERFWGNSADKACNYANVADQASKREFGWSPIHDCDDGFIYTMPVGKKLSNNFGLFDMLGNVWEWTCSAYTNPYDKQAQQCGSGDGRRVLRGGSWVDEPAGVRSAGREGGRPADRGNDGGFRVARIR